MAYPSTYDTFRQVAKRLQKIWTNRRYKAKLLANSEFARAELAECGVTIPHQVEVRVVDLTDKNVYYVILPPPPQRLYSRSSLQEKADFDAIYIQSLESHGL